MNKAVDVIVGSPICRRGAFIIDKFLANQKEIQRNYPQSELVLATEESDFVEELEKRISFYELRGRVILFEVIKPDYARHRVWNIACGREALRQYVLFQTAAGYLLSLDADITYDPSIIQIMKKEIQGYDVAISGVAHSQRALQGGRVTTLSPVSCSLLARDTLEKIKLRCYEFRNGEALDDGIALEMDLIRLRSKIKKGFFISISHYTNESEAVCIDPRPLGLLLRITNSSLVRYGLTRVGIVVRRDISMRLQVLLYRFLGIIKRI